MAIISAMLSFYLKTVFVFFILNGVATACCIGRIAENGWFEIEVLREGLTIFEILAVSVVPFVRMFFFIGIIVMAHLDAEEYYRYKYGENDNANDMDSWVIEEEVEEDSDEG